MNIEKLKHAIVDAALGQAPDLNGKLLVYAEVHDDVMEHGLFYERGAAREVMFKDGVDDLRYLLQELRDQWQAVRGNKPWSAFACLVEGADVQFDLSSHAPATGLQQRPLDRHMRVFERGFGDTEFGFAMSVE